MQDYCGIEKKRLQIILSSHGWIMNGSDQVANQGYYAIYYSLITLNQHWDYPLATIEALGDIN